MRTEKNEELLLSIVMPVYNNLKFLEAAVESVEKQNKDNYELIIVDDGSTDGTDKLVDKLAKQYENIQAIHQDNQWIYASFNNGIKAARGKYIFILNSDDKMAEGTIEEFSRTVEKYNYPDVIWTKCVACYCDSGQNVYKRISVNEDVVEERYYSKDESKKLIETVLSTMQIGGQFHFYKRDLMLKHPYHNVYAGDDRIFNFEILPDIKHSVIIPFETYLFHYYDDKSNAGAKYYGNEHSMYNEWYISAKQMLRKCGITDRKVLDIIRKERRNNLSTEVKLILRQDFKNEEKFEMIFSNTWDEIVSECFDDREEFDARILSAVRAYLINNTIEEGSKYYFVFELIDVLLRYEKTEEDMNKLKTAVNDSNNPFNIGEVFLKKLNIKGYFK